MNDYSQNKTKISLRLPEKEHNMLLQIMDGFNYTKAEAVRLCIRYFYFKDSEEKLIQRDRMAQSIYSWKTMNIANNMNQIATALNSVMKAYRESKEYAGYAYLDEETIKNTSNQIEDLMTKYYELSEFVMHAIYLNL